MDRFDTASYFFLILVCIMTATCGDLPTCPHDHQTLGYKVADGCALRTDAVCCIVRPEAKRCGSKVIIPAAISLWGRKLCKCPEGSFTNTVDNTCVHLVEMTLDYASAKAHCESLGEQLAVFPTRASTNLFMDFLSDQPSSSAWARRSSIWIGLHLDGDVGWSWDGRVTDAVSQDDPVWGGGEPDDFLGNAGFDNVACGTIRHDDVTGLHDWPDCILTAYFVCEFDFLP